MEKDQVQLLIEEKEELEKELNEVRKERNEQREESGLYENILSSILSCGSLDVREIASMESNFPGVTDRANELREEYGTSMNFGMFVLATKELAIDRVESDLTDEQVQVLQDIIIDDNYVAWGGITEYGSPREELTEAAQELFVQYVQTGSEEDKEEFLSLVNGKDVE